MYHPSYVLRLNNVNFSFISYGHICFSRLWWRAGLMVRAFDSGSSGLGSSPGRGHCFVFLNWARHFSKSASGVKMGTSELTGKPNKFTGSDLRWTSIEIEILPAAS